MKKTYLSTKNMVKEKENYVGANMSNNLGDSRGVA